ncbi:hypothetical protein DID88_002117 [Monilinia fructigena]|uniref:Zn(2)-C6 fungal-type domain-containing protein n=1 Tax=Monilinia fructigena TaxID=38457 RepID=A0A395IV94_9HELO|nr:hypothetical protein DID88_002117 [Monilinia fructigena]
MEEYNMERTVPPKVSRHGKACVNCARAKVKCVENNGVGACERCHRLAKDCQSITRTKRRKPVKKTTAAKTAELEQKLDGLVSLLNAANRIQDTTSSTASDHTALSQCHYQQRPVWSSMVQLAMGLVYDLGLNKAPPKEAPHLLLNFDARGRPKPFLPPAGSRQENRALLCLFSLSSRMHRGTTPPVIATQSFKAPASFYLKALKSQIENFKQQIPNEVRDNHTFLMHLYNTKLTIHEFISLQRACFRYGRLSTLRIPLYLLSILALYRLSVFEDPQWDVQLMRQQLDFSFVLDRIIKTWENVKNAAGLDEGMIKVDDVDIYTTNSKRIGLIKTWWDAKVAAETSGSVPSEKFANVNGSGSGCENITEQMAQAQHQGLEIPTFGMDMGQEPWMMVGGRMFSVRGVSGGYNDCTIYNALLNPMKMGQVGLYYNLAIIGTGKEKFVVYRSKEVGSGQLEVMYLYMLYNNENN